MSLGGKGVPALNIILSPLWNLPDHSSSAYGRALDNPQSAFTAIYEDWNTATTGMTESAQCWPSLRTMLAPYFQIEDSYITSEQLPDHPTRPELGDVVYVDYPCSFPATLEANASNYTVICNLATKIWEACNFRADAHSEASNLKTNKGGISSRFVGYKDGYPTFWQSTVLYEKAFPSIAMSMTPNPVHAYLSHNLENIVTGCTGHMPSGQLNCSVRRVFFMITAVEHSQLYTLEARRTGSPTSALRRTSSNRDLFHDDPYVFHRNPTKTAHIDADSDTPKPWGHWSTSKDCAHGEYVIPAAPNEDAFRTMPGVELDGFRLKTRAYPESEKYIGIHLPQSAGH
ncbi:hypothetical protein PLICRDRAFT_46858 [Plicaturopsis crispa FD-325 SS-3]|uniref:Uncharacterized protein n=1 Tax=Plicaturopsis crispa FD-325 SS-3 TaxID=944288 RepID=A0A0C9SQF8_PLICR|nr:hypothetical protein PLICRDRAFT_46858 [Plicaturopsis crispa FD-325 SS-3]